MADLGFDLEQGTFGVRLYMAAVHGRVAMVELLVGRGFDLSATDPEGTYSEEAALAHARRAVYSPPQALAQCRGYLERHLPGAEPVASLR